MAKKLKKFLKKAGKAAAVAAALYGATKLGGKKYNTAKNVLDAQGFDLTNHKLKYTEMWVQEFTRTGGGHHDTHIHWNNHISGFYFLKCSEKTSAPIFHDPRPGKMMIQLPEKEDDKITYASSKMVLKPKPGSLIMFNSFFCILYLFNNALKY